ncbi:MAG: hypothetical protein AB7G28_15690 [Pirellulales bacterium]
MKFNLKFVGGLAIGAVIVQGMASSAMAADAYPVITDINAGAQNFGASAGSFGGIYTVNSNATLNGNAVLSINQKGQLACCHGALIEISVSNGENGVNSTEGGLNVDVPNSTPANPVFAAIGNASGKLTDGNVIRFSAWFRSDPANPITLDPQVQPILKIEYWKEALSANADSNAAQVAPQFGDRIFDQDQQGSAIGIPDLPSWVDLNGDGVVLDASATVGNGRVVSTTTGEWRLASVTHKVNTADWLGIGAEGFGFNDITAVESFKAVMFMGDFANTNLTGDGADGGNLLIDNALVEVFKDAASVTPLNNPNPTLSEVTGLAGDYNENHKVDAADYTTWRDRLGSGTALPNDDTTGVGDDDYTRWKTNFGMSSPGGGSLGASAVPEPTTWMLAMFLLVGSMIPRRNK